MHRPEPVDVALSPSRILRGWIMMLALVTCAVTLALPLAWWSNALIVVSVCGWAALELRGRRRGHHALRHLRVEDDRSLSIAAADGRTLRGRVLPASYVGARLTTLVWRPVGRNLARAEILLPDMLTREDFRRLRVLLRHGRSEPMQGAPPNHA